MRTPLRLPSFKDLSLAGKGSPPGGSASPEIQPAGFAPGLDLLRERRRQIGQESITVALADRRRLLVQGTTVGAIFLGLMVGSIGLVYLRHQMVLGQMGRLNEVEAEAVQLRQQLGARKARLAQITTINKQLVLALTSVRSSSALMKELQLRLPAGIQLSAADTAGGSLVLRGQTFDPQAFERINAFQLELQNSPLLDPKAISLTKVERKAPDANLPPGVRPQVTGGLVRRLELLQREGLLP